LGKGNFVLELSSEFTGYIGLNFAMHHGDGLIGLSTLNRESSALNGTD
jgi:hypothetical protein